MPPHLLSRRLPADLTPSPLHTALAEGRRTGGPVCDLMQSNPTQCGFIYPELTDVLLGPASWHYDPDPFGLPCARAALAAYLTSSDVPVSSNDLVLTASTSEAYSMLFKLLCAPGDAVATGTPSYPLVPHLAELDGVETVDYRWVRTDAGWQLDFDSVLMALRNPRVRALVIVDPNSPIGAALSPADFAALSRACTAAEVVLIVDAVFAPYAQLDTDTLPPRLLLPPSCIQWGATVVLSGLSKAAGLPQLKLGWISLHGAPAWVAQLRRGLEWIADAYLSVNTPVQRALPHLLPHLAQLQVQIRLRLQTNRRSLAEALVALRTFALLPAEAGWYAVVQGPAALDEDGVVQHLQAQARVQVHPGYYYGFEQGGLFVLGLLLPPPQFASAAARLAAALAHLEA
jgi:aspartate/methionine/tyrosine aminotransferase